MFKYGSFVRVWPALIVNSKYNRLKKTVQTRAVIGLGYTRTNDVRNGGKTQAPCSRMKLCKLLRHVGPRNRDMFISNWK